MPVDKKVAALVEVAFRLRQERERIGLGQYEFANKMGVNPVVYGRYELFC
jgi:stalled ribosome alternative rescue factor ArfA